MTAPAARFDDVTAGRSLQFVQAERVISVQRPEEVRGALAEVQDAVDGGAWAFGMVAYEAAAGLDPAARVRAPQEGLPLVWFGLAAAPDEDPPPLTTGEGFEVAPWVPDWSPSEHAVRVEAVRAAIAEGDTYQANLTTRLRSHVAGDAFGLYGELAQRQRGAHHAFLDLGRHRVVSASPESFLDWEDGVLRTAPMKGTAARGRTPEADRTAREALLASEKDRAENVMIVDLLRNDLARVCEPGSVQVTELLRAEEYPTLWQLTSRIRGRARPQASFNVAIRTVVIDGADGSAVYGAGGGITWDSTPAGEYEELLVKTAVLPTGTRDPFALLETLAVVGGAARHVEAHAERMQTSAAHFGIPLERAQLEAVIRDAAAAATGEDLLLRVALRRDGSLETSTRPLVTPPGPVRIALDTVRTVFPPGLSAHKTTVREHFTAARERHPDADDVVLLGEHGRAVETTIASFAARIDGVWCTPPLSDGCLNGVGRRLALERGELVERPLSVEALCGAEELAVLSAARGMRRAVLVGS